MVTDEFNAFLRIRAPSSLLKFVDSLSTTSTDKSRSSKKNARSPSAAPMSATLPYLPLQSSSRSTPPPATSRSNTGRFRSVAYGYQNGLGRCANFVFQSSCSLVSASSRSDDVFPGALFDLAQRLTDSLSMRGKRVGSTRNLLSASKIFDACRDRLGDSRFTAGTLLHGCGLLQTDAS